MSKAVVIGTGAGGLAAAIGLAEQGHDVVALEAAKQLGGFLNPFARRHYHFDPGVHYIGQLGPGQSMTLTLEKLGLDAQQLFCPMDDDCLDMIRFPGLEVRVPKGIDNYRQRLRSQFPEDKGDIDKLFKVLKRFDRVSNFISRKTIGASRRIGDLGAVTGLSFAAKWLERSFAELLAEYIKNPELRSVLAGQCGDYALPPSRTPAVLGMGLMMHYASGAWFPRGGSGVFRDALVERGRSLGASYRRRAAVASIELDNGRVSGVTLTTGERIDADIVVSAIDPTLTLGKLLPEGTLSERLQTKVDNTESSVGSVCVFLGMQRDLSKHGLGAFNVWDYPHFDLERLYAPAFEGKIPEEWFFFLSPNSLKDDSNSMAPAGGSTLEVVTLCPHAPFAQWADSKSFKRGDDYNQLKDEVAAQLMGAVEDRWPGLVGDVVVEEVASPLTNTHYAGAVEGAAYGPAATLDQYGRRRFRTKAPVEGLYLAGAGVYGGGVAPCLMSGIAAARKVLAERPAAVSVVSPSPDPQGAT
ncbi:MAG: phytoene desaturase family protein [Bradymonadia bacterium]